MFDFLRHRAGTEHEQTRQDLSAFIDGELAPRERARAQKHLDTCAACRAELESLRRTVALLRAVPTVRPPRSFLLPVGEARRQRQVQRRQLAYAYLQGATAVATVLLVLAVSGDMMSRFGAARQQQAAPQAVTAPSALDSRAGLAVATAYAEFVPEAMVLVTPPPPVPEKQGEGAQRQAQPSPQPPTAAAKSLGGAEAQPTEVLQAVPVGEVPTLLPGPSRTFAQSAAPPAPPILAMGAMTPTETAVTAAGTTATLLPPNETVPPTSTPAPPTPTVTPVPLTPVPLAPATAQPEEERPSPQPAAGLSRDHGRAPPQAAGWPTSLAPFSRYLPWIERALAVAVVSLWAATLLLRRQRRRV